jgi:hypothetical protein
MFKNDDVVTDEDVGNFVKELHATGTQELHDYILGEDDGLENNSTATSSGTQSKD